MSYMKVPRRLILLAVFALAGIGVSIALTKHYYEIRSGAAGFSSYCNLGKSMNCDVVAASSYAELVGGIPLSAFGTGWFVALFAIALIARNSFWRREALRVATGLTAFGSLMSLVYLLIMASVIKTYCLLCLVVDGLAFTSFALVISLKPEGFGAHKPDPSKWKTLVGVVAGSLLISVLGLKALDRISMDSAVADSVVAEATKGPVVAVAVDESFPSIGPRDAPVTIVEFSDFQCPYCRIAAVTLNSVLNHFPGKVRIVFRNYPLDSTCNKSMTRSVHATACEAARASFCANQQGKFQAMYEVLFDKQSTLVPGRPAELAAEIGGIDTRLLQGCMASMESEMAVAKDIGEGTRLGIQSTPTFFVNGRKVEGALPVPIWNRIIDRLLSQ